MYMEANKIIKRVRLLGPVGWRMRHKIAWAIIKQYDNVIGVRWEEVRDGKYILCGLNAIKNHKYIEVHDESYNKSLNLT